MGHSMPAESWTREAREAREAREIRFLNCGYIGPVERKLECTIK